MTEFNGHIANKSEIVVECILISPVIALNHVTTLSAFSFENTKKANL